MMVTQADALADIDSIFAKLSLEITKRPMLTVPEKKARVARFVLGLINIITNDVCHGDIKPANILWDDERFDIADFGGSLILSKTVQKMNPKYAFENEADKQKMQTFLNIFCAPNPDAAKIKAACERSAAKIEQLVSWKIFGRDRKQNIKIKDKKKLAELREYMKTQFLPAKSDGYASNHYTTTICDYFWRCDADNFKRACNAFDIRAAGITIYSIFTAAHTPKNEHDKAYYDQLEVSLQATKISEKAIKLIRSMAEPMKDVDTSPGKLFPLPVTVEELHELRAELLK